MDRIETVGDLIVALECYDLDTRIRLASQPGWPFEYTIGGIALTPDDAEHNGTATTDEPVCGSGGPSGRLPARHRQQRAGMVPVTAALSGLAARAVSAAHRARDAEPDGFAQRHQDWRTWQRRARLGRGAGHVYLCSVGSSRSRKARSQGRCPPGCTSGARGHRPGP
jgi:hypothetical protein